MRGVPVSVGQQNPMSARRLGKAFLDYNNGCLDIHAPDTPETLQKLRTKFLKAKPNNDLLK